MLHSICCSVSILIVLTVTAMSCQPSKRSEDMKSISPEAFERITRSEDWYSYYGSGYIRGTTDGGIINLDLVVSQVSINPVMGTVKIAGVVVDFWTRELLPNSDVVVGTVEYRKDGSPHRFLTKKGVISGVNSEFVIEAKIEEGDRLFVGHLSYHVKVYDVYKLIYPP